ncbi:MAG: hypothetical protein KAJ79_08795, partial [Candidatus Omnitrophica bacterium]|nr:hypothetical protein [Candidatus Omnitrophota bacterium]
HLAELDQIKIETGWEFITFAIDLCEKLIHLRNGDVKAAEEQMQVYSQGQVPFYKELYLKGKEISKKGDSAYILKPHQSEEARGYFSIDLLVIEAISFYESRGVPVDFLRRYLHNKNKALNTPFGKEQFYRDEYSSQTVASLMLSGIFMDEYEKHKIHPVRTMADYFSELDKIFGPPNQADKIWIEKELIPELEALAQQLFGKKVILEGSKVTDRIGLWWAEADRWSGTIYYWPFTIYPKMKDDLKREAHRKNARERGIGNLLLALYRFMYTKDEDIEKSHSECFSRKEFSLLWDTLLTSRAVFTGLPSTQRKVKADKTLGEYVEIPSMIGNVFKEKYNLGNKKVEKELFKSYPLHLQFLDSIIYRWSQYDAETRILDDARVEAGSLIDKAVRDTFESWVKVMFQVDK